MTNWGAIWASETNPLGWGLAGNVVAEAISFKENIIIFLYPILMLIYGKFINILLKTQSLTGMISFMLSVVFLQSMFRGSFLDIAFYPFYNIIFFGFWIIGIDALYYKKRRLNKI